MFNKSFMNFSNSLWALLLIGFLATSCSDKTETHEHKQGNVENQKSEDQSSDETAAADPVITMPETDQTELELIPHVINHPNGTTFTLNVPKGFDIKPVAWGMKRIRFMAQSPDERLFLTDMYNLEDNSKGSIYILKDFDDSSMTFKSRVTYLENLRNP